ncbi:MAG: dihydroorotase [Alphaproteobacteria bacterium]
MTEGDTIRLIRPDDWHLHVRDGAMLAAVLPYTANVFGRAIIMPNLAPPVTTVRAAEEYRERIVERIPAGSGFTPLMTCYLTDTTDPAELRAGHRSGVFSAVKLYPAGATTNSESGVTSMAKVAKALEAMQEIGLPLLLHGEVVDPEIDVFDREAVFIERVLLPLRRDFPALRVVFEHVTTRDAVDYVMEQDSGIGATITPHHLTINRNALFRGGLRPHMYCLPVAKREEHRLALRAAATSGDPRFFLGTDSAPHAAHAKETDCGCAGIFNAPTAMRCVAQVFDEERALGRLEAFASLNGARFYGMEANSGHIVLRKSAAAPEEDADESPQSIPLGDHSVRIFVPDQPLHWRIVAEERE